MPVNRSQLNKTLFLAAGCCLDPMFRNDTDAVREKRDFACTEMYGVGYKALTDGQMIDLINELQVQSGYTSPDQIKPPIASNRQLKLLRFYAMSCALYFMDFESMESRDPDTGDVLTGYDLKFNTQRMFDSNKGFMPPGIFYTIHKKWINPKMHKFLIDGGFKKYTKNPENFHWEYLKPQEAQYLIKRFGQIFQNIPDVFIPGDIQEMINVN